MQSTLPPSSTLALTARSVGTSLLGRVSIGPSVSSLLPPPGEIVRITAAAGIAASVHNWRRG